MNYHNITHEDMLNGDGMRVVLWVAGCEHHCPECQNPETWCKDGGIPFDDSALNELITELEKDYISGITFSGGDPLAPFNESEVSNICYYVKHLALGKTIWVYTGYTYEELLERKSVFTNDILAKADILVDGEYKKDLRNVNLKWRGSSNQRVIDLRKTEKEGKVILHCE